MFLCPSVTSLLCIKMEIICRCILMHSVNFINLLVDTVYWTLIVPQWTNLILIVSTALPQSLGLHFHPMLCSGCLELATKNCQSDSVTVFKSRLKTYSSFLRLSPLFSVAHCLAQCLWSYDLMADMFIIIIVKLKYTYIIKVIVPSHTQKQSNCAVQNVHRVNE